MAQSLEDFAEWRSCKASLSTFQSPSTSSWFFLLGHQVPDCLNTLVASDGPNRLPPRLSLTSSRSHVLYFMCLFFTPLLITSVVQSLNSESCSVLNNIRTYRERHPPSLNNRRRRSVKEILCDSPNGEQRLVILGQKCNEIAKRTLSNFFVQSSA